MSLKKSECRPLKINPADDGERKQMSGKQVQKRQKISWKRKSGKIEMITGLYLLVFLVVLLTVQIQMRIFMTSGFYMEDALAASNLASAVIDIREYGMSHVIRIQSPDTAYELYREALKENLQLDDNWENDNKALIYGRVRILKYEVYNVEKGDITIYSYGEEGENVRFVPGGAGNVRTPDGTIVESTSVYSKIEFPVRGILGMETQARKHKTVDIISNLLQEEGGS